MKKGGSLGHPPLGFFPSQRTAGPMRLVLV